MEEFLDDESLDFSQTKIRIVGVLLKEDLELFDLGVLIDEVLGEVFCLCGVHVIVFDDFGVLRFLDKE